MFSFSLFFSAVGRSELLVCDAALSSWISSFFFLLFY